jgi:hypothetical protein
MNVSWVGHIARMIDKRNITKLGEKDDPGLCERLTLKWILGK